MTTCSRPELNETLSSLQTFLSEGSTLRLENVQAYQTPDMRNLVLMATTDTSTLLQQVLSRFDDVRLMCEKRVNELQKLTERDGKPKPIQPVSPERHVVVVEEDDILSPNDVTMKVVNSPKHSAKPVRGTMDMCQPIVIQQRRLNRDVPSSPRLSASLPFSRRLSLPIFSGLGSNNSRARKAKSVSPTGTTGKTHTNFCFGTKFTGSQKISAVSLDLPHLNQPSSSASSSCSPQAPTDGGLDSVSPRRSVPHKSGANSHSPLSGRRQVQRHSVISTGSSSSSSKSRTDYIVEELLHTETVYVEELGSVLRHYVADGLHAGSMAALVPEALKVTSSSPNGVQSPEDCLFGNLESIYDFHRSIFLARLRAATTTAVNTSSTTSAEGSIDPSAVAQCFLSHRDYFYLYHVYCQNKPKSDALRERIGETDAFFKECQSMAGHRLPLGAYLLKPVQRITKYQLLLKELSKCTKDTPHSYLVEEALQCMLGLLNQLNSSMYQAHITGYPGDLTELGQLQLHGHFTVWTSNKRTSDSSKSGGGSMNLNKLRRTGKSQQRHLFLYSKALLLCKLRHQPPPYDPQEYFEYKTHIPVSWNDLGSMKLNKLGRTGKSQQRHLFLYSKALLLCKLRHQPPPYDPQEYFEYKTHIPVSWNDLGSMKLNKLRRTGKSQQRHLFLYSKALLLCKLRHQPPPYDPQEYFEYKTHIPVVKGGMGSTIYGMMTSQASKRYDVIMPYMEA